MSRRLELEQRLRQLGEIGEIMRSMKNLALMETRKLGRFLEAQKQAVGAIESAAADFLSFHPVPVLFAREGKQAVLAIGSERGFCGDFNEEILAELAACPSGECLVMAVGGKLCARLDNFPGTVVPFVGPSVAEDVPEMLNGLVGEIGARHRRGENLHLTVVHHCDGDTGISRKALLPPFSDASRTKTGFDQPPLLYLAPERFFAELLDHYLFAALHGIFYASLMAENQRRMHHLEGAIHRLGEKTDDYARRCRALRQEEITEEIEVILLSAESLIR
jgi:F-type H+-transporting ATPase subunit gamma